MATPIIDSGQCEIYVSNSYDTSGSLTKSTLRPATPDQMYAAFRDIDDTNKWNEMNAYLVNQFEMQMCGIRRNSFYDWLMSSARGQSKLVNIRSVARGPSLIEPFILGQQESVVNDEEWIVDAGYRTAASGNAPYSDSGTTYVASSTGPLSSLSGGDRVIRVIPGYGITPDAQYFLEDHRLLLLGRSSGGTVKFGTWKIISAAAEAADPPTYVDVLIAAETPDNAAAHFAAQPNNGIARLMMNNVQDVETWCNNRINVNPIKMVPFWWQASRKVRKISSIYLEVRQKLIRDNAWFAKFQDLDDARRNAQDEQKWQREFINAFLFQDAIGANQTLDLWKNLEQVTTVSSSGLNLPSSVTGQLVAFRANAIGVIPQLRSCGQVEDFQNASLNIREWVEETIYEVWRNRRDGKLPTGSIDVYTDSDSAAEAESAMIAWYTDRYGDIQRVQIERGKTYGYSWRSFEIPTKPHGVTINFIVHETFDDLINGFTDQAIESAGRFLMCLDIGSGGSIYPAMIASNRKVHTVGQLQDLARVDSTYACVMENPTETVQMMSQIWTAVVECPLRSHVAHNYSDIRYDA